MQDLRNEIKARIAAGEAEAKASALALVSRHVKAAFIAAGSSGLFLGLLAGWALWAK
jgi:hypothetical protein